MSIPSLPPDLRRYLAELEQRVQRLESTRRVVAATIGSGGLTVTDSGKIAVKDTDGTTRVVLGEDDGDYDVSLFDAAGGGKIALSDVLRGIEVDVFDGALSSTSPTFEAKTNGPAVTVDIGGSGAAMVMFGAFVLASSQNGVDTMSSVMAYDIAGASTQSAPVLGTVREYVRSVENTDEVHSKSNGSRVDFVTGLNAGSTTFDTRYRWEAFNNPTLAAVFEDPWILAIPL